MGYPGGARANFAAPAVILASLALTLSACGAPQIVDRADQRPSGSAESTDEGRGDLIDDTGIDPPTTETVTMTDPVASSFSVEVPLGWDTIAYSTGTYDDHREAVVSVSPDGNTVLFVGDPKAPAYWEPDHPDNRTEFVHNWVDGTELAEFRRYTYATEWVEEWVQRKFGGLDSFVVLGTEDRPDEAQALADTVQNATGIRLVAASAAKTHFRYDTENGPVSGYVSGATLSNGQTWSGDVQGLSTLGEPDAYDQMLRAMARSKRTDPNWVRQRDNVWAQQRAQSEAFTQQLIANHHANMQWIRNSAAAHQSRMQAIWAANDASMANYYQRMDSMDANQRSFLNYINEENTVSTPTGQSFQVASGATTYYVNPTTGKYIGGDINLSEKDLRAMGLNPSDWELTQVVR